MAKRYIVTAPYVTLETGTAQGRAIVGFYQGAPVPVDVPHSVVMHHLDRGLIEEIPEAVVMPTADELKAADKALADERHEGDGEPNPLTGPQVPVTDGPNPGSESPSLPPTSQLSGSPAARGRTTPRDKR